MIADSDMNDSPITRPAADAYGFDSFAAALARSIARMSAPDGFVIAIDGPWGSGKSSVINLLLHHLRTDVPVKGLDVKTFSPWWYAGSDSITRGFFETLGDVVSGSLRGKAKRQAGRALKGLVERIRPAKSFVGPVGDVAAEGLPAGTVALAIADAAVEAIGAKRSLSEEYARLSEALRDHGRRVLVVVDDIDRLDPDDATLVFQLVKSVGRLPNVLYLLAFDSTMATRQLDRRFGSAAADYLDKVVQATYSIPVPGRSQLLSALIKAVGPLVGDVGSPGNVTRFWNHVHDCVAPWLHTPRDVVRLVNLMAVGWPAITGEANARDFLALEALKLSHPEVYRAVQRNQSLLCGIEARDLSVRRTHGERAAEYDQIFLASVPEKNRPELHIALRRLFPRLDAVYTNSWHGADQLASWRRDRLVCSPAHFSTYFQLSPSPDVLSTVEVRTLMTKLGDTPGLSAMLEQAVTERKDASSGTRARLMLEELRDRVREIPVNVVEPLLTALFQVADEIDVRADDLGISGWGNNLRIWWLVRDLLPRHADQEARSQILLDLAHKCQIAWLADLAAYCWDQHNPAQNSREVPSEERLVTADAAVGLRQVALERIRQAATTGALIYHPRLRDLLFYWAHSAGDNGQDVQHWTAARLDEDASVVRFADRFTWEGEAMALGGMGFLGDRVATRTPQVDREALTRICDVRRLDERATAILDGNVAAPDAEILKRYLEARQPGRMSLNEDE